MQFQTARSIVSNPLFFHGLALFIVSSYCSYAFLLANYHKVFMAGAGVTILFIMHDILFLKKNQALHADRNIFISTALLALPLIGTLPGYVYHKGAYSYMFTFELSNYLILLLWAWYFMRLANNEHDINVFISITAGTIIFVSTIAFLEKSGLYPLPASFTMADRVKSTFGNPNYFAGFLDLLLPIFFALAFTGKNVEGPGGKKIFHFIFSRERILYLMASTAGCAALIMTKTRGAYLGLFTGLLLMALLTAIFFMEIKRKKLILSIIGAICFIVMLSALSLFLFHDFFEKSRFDVFFNFRGISWQSRFVGWGTAMKAIMSSPLLGYGPGSSYNLFFSFVDPASRLYYPDRDLTHVHSEFLEYFQEGGIFGMALFFCFWGYIFFMCLRIIKNSSLSPFLRRLSLGILSGFAAYHVEGLFDVAPRMMVVRLPLFSLLAMVFVIKKISASDNNKPAPWPLKKRLLAVTLPGLVLVTAIWAMYLPLAISNRAFVDIGNSAVPLNSKIIQLEKLRDTNPNIYLLSTLGNIEASFKRKDELKKTMDAIDLLVPGYLHTDFHRALYAGLAGDDPEALKLAVRYQEKDLYFMPCIEFLSRLAAKYDTRELFKRELELLFHRFIVPNVQLNISSPEGIFFMVKKDSIPLSITEKNSDLYILMGDDFFERIFSLAKKAAMADSIAKSDIRAFIDYTDKAMAAIPYFQIKFREDVSYAVRNDAVKYLKNYIILDNRKFLAVKKTEKYFDNAMNLAPDLETRKSLSKKRGEALLEIEKKFQPFMENAVSNLSRHTFWRDYLAKRRLALDIIDGLLSLAIPGIDVNEIVDVR